MFSEKPVESSTCLVLSSHREVAQIISGLSVAQPALPVCQLLPQVVIVQLLTSSSSARPRIRPWSFGGSVEVTSAGSRKFWPRDGAPDAVRLVAAVVRLLDGVLDGVGRQLGPPGQPRHPRVRGHRARRLRGTRYARVVQTVAGLKASV